MQSIEVAHQEKSAVNPGLCSTVGCPGI